MRQVHVLIVRDRIRAASIPSTPYKKGWQAEGLTARRVVEYLNAVVGGAIGLYRGEGHAVVDSSV